MAKNRLEALESSAVKVARQLVSRDSLRVVVAGSMACWDSETDTLYLPSYSTENPVEEMSEQERRFLADAWRGLLDHEMSHAKNTDATVWCDRMEEWRAKGYPAQRLHALAHVFEDPYVEAVWGDEYIGSQKFIKTLHTYTIAKTGGAGPCWPEWKGKSGNPIGAFEALLQAILRLDSGLVQRNEVSPQIIAVIDHCQDILDKFDRRAGTAHNCDLTEELWLRIQAMMPKEEETQETQETQGQQGEEQGDGAPSSSGGQEEGEDEGDSEGQGQGQGSESGDSPSQSSNDGGKQSDNPSQGGKPSGERSEQSEGEKNKGGAGQAPPATEEELKSIASEIMGGEWGKIESASELLSGDFVGKDDPKRAPWSVHPDCEELDQWVTYDAKQRKGATKQLKMLKEAVTGEASYLASRLRRAIVAQRKDLWVGAQEDGEILDIDSLPYLAANLDNRRVWSQRFGKPAENTFVCVMVDCSGSMGDNKVMSYCPVHGENKQTGDKCSRNTGFGKCGHKLDRVVNTKAGYAAMTAVCLHDALRLAKVEHCVLGYTTGDYTWANNPTEPHGFKRWSRMTGVRTLEFVAAPGLSDKGDALPFISGTGANIDGESIRVGAKYALKKAGDASRIIMLVIADGLPYGADDERMNDEYLRRSVEDIANIGIEVYGIGIGIRNGKKFKEFYPDNPGSGQRAGTGSVLIPTGQGLSREVLNSLLDHMVLNNGRRRHGR